MKLHLVISLPKFEHIYSETMIVLPLHGFLYTPVNAMPL